MTSPAVNQPKFRASDTMEAPHSPADMSVRELVGMLSEIEDTLRETPFLVPRHGMMVVNPDVAPLLARQRSVVAQLRARRVSWRSGDLAGRRSSSAAWPIPPWA
jgi:hypothetical protein